MCLSIRQATDGWCGMGVMVLVFLWLDFVTLLAAHQSVDTLSEEEEVVAQVEVVVLMFE